MIKYIKSKSILKRSVFGILICLVFFIVGEVILHISTMENPQFGNTIYILIGSTFVFSSGLGFLLILKYLYDTNKKQQRREKRRQKHKVHYLKDQLQNQDKNLD